MPRRRVADKVSTMDIPRTITVRYEYDPAARAWSAVADTGGSSWGRTFAQARTSIREALALWYDLPDDRELSDMGVEVLDVPVVGGRPLDAVHSLATRRAEVERLHDAVARESREVARILVDGGISVRDAGAIIGVSHGRVAQYVAHDPKPKVVTTRRRKVVRSSPGRGVVRQREART